MSDVNIPNALTPFPGVICCGQPSAQHLQEAQSQGFKTIINLRPASEQVDWDEAAAAQEMGFAYVNIPVASAADFSRETIDCFHAALNDNPGPFIVHCASGNRVGALFAMRAAWVEGKAPAEALEIGRQSGMTGLEPAIAQLLKS